MQHYNTCVLKFKCDSGGRLLATCARNLNLGDVVAVLSLHLCEVLIDNTGYR